MDRQSEASNNCLLNAEHKVLPNLVVQLKEMVCRVGKIAKTLKFGGSQGRILLSKTKQETNDSYKIIHGNKFI